MKSYSSTLVTNTRVRRCPLCSLAAGLAILALVVPGVGQAAANSRDVPALREALSQKGAFFTTVDYVVHFYPLWFTYNQFQLSSRNRLVGPDRISPIYQTVVAINDDTLYGSTVLDLTDQPVILTIPATTATYSVLTLNPYGDIFDSGIPPLTSGIYALTGPGWTGKLPAGVTAVPIPLNISILIFRVDKFASTGEDQTADAQQFRESLEMRPLCAYLEQPCPHGVPPGGTTLIVPEIAFSIPFKTAADTLIARDPITFLKMLQTAVASSNTPPMSPQEQALSQAFDNLFGNGDFGPRSRHAGTRAEFSAGAQAAHELIVERYLGHTGPTGWIHFTNIGAWGDHFIERSSITEFIQFGNGTNTAAYYHTFRDANRTALDGSNPRGYVLTFPAGQLPAAKRFWSVTAYTPNSIELVKNPANKYVVASYTPGLSTNTDNSLSIYMSAELPPGVPMANWLPIPRRRFNIMLRVYGPEGSVADNTYVPPGIERIRQVPH